ncbi:MAG: manganese efflux pump MntP family protein [Eubacterium sp.]|jgi:putative Mn2+ efflux pump MntP
MSTLELFILAVGLSMDAFAVSVCKGLSVDKVKMSHMAICGAYFGGFQALMPLIGYFLGSRFAKFITEIDHWIAFILLAAIGIQMIVESRKEGAAKGGFGVSSMLPLAIATSIDALAVGVSFAFLEVNIFYACVFIGVTTFVLSALGVKAGSIFGAKAGSRAELAGGIILVCIGTKILIEHLGIIG